MLWFSAYGATSAPTVIDNRLMNFINLLKLHAATQLQQTYLFPCSSVFSAFIWIWFHFFSYTDNDPTNRTINQFYEHWRAAQQAGDTTVKQYHLKLMSSKRFSLQLICALDKHRPFARCNSNIYSPLSAEVCITKHVRRAQNVFPLAALTPTIAVMLCGHTKLSRISQCILVKKKLHLDEAVCADQTLQADFTN